MHATDLTAERVIEFLRGEQREQPFCLSVSFNAPHAEDSNSEQYIWPASVEHLYRDLDIAPAPQSDDQFFKSQPQFLQESLNRVRWAWRFQTPEMYQNMVRGYYRMISGVDAALARIVDELEALGLADNTVIIFASDNGYFLNDRGFAGKWLPYDASLRVPLIVVDPRVPEALQGSAVAAIALNIDISATILDIAEVDRPRIMQGASLLPWVIGRTPDNWREVFFCEHRMEHPQIPKHEGVRSGNYRYSRYYEQDPVYEELFDLRNDPSEVNNLVNDPDHVHVLARLRAMTDAMLERFRAAAESN